RGVVRPSAERARESTGRNGNLAPPAQMGLPAAPARPAAAPDKAPPAAVPVAIPVAQPDSMFDIAISSPEARRGLGTGAGLYEPILYTRQLARAWDRAGRYLQTTKPPSRPTEFKDLSERLKEISELMELFPPILGQPGQPGYRVVAMARLAMTPAMLQNLDDGQREALARDWLAGHVVLKTHLVFLRQEVKAYRRRTWLGKGVRAVRAALNDHPAWVSLIALLTVAVAAVALWASL